MLKNLSCFLAAMVLMGAVSCTRQTEAGPQRTAGRFLEKTYAEYRSRFVSQVQYDFEFDLTQAEIFSGISKINFNLSSPTDLTLDFFDGKVSKVVVNRQSVEVVYNQFFILIPKKYLTTGVNSIEVVFTHPYSKTGAGLYRFVDPEDKKVYIYSDFEPYDANAMVPCFDQPDIKADYAAKVTVPQEWTVVSSTLESKREMKNENALWTFPRSARFSTYIYSLHAGPYKIWSTNIKTKNHTVPHRVMVRQSLAKYVDPEEWFVNTRKGFEFFEEFFGYAYPFLKYDEIIVPDFNSGAMENVAAVTFNENRYVSRSKKTLVEKRSQASVQLHELAHMWFGDLVTMKWWNDIWLNESFATYASYRALLANTDFKDQASVNFMSKAKGSAYWEDQLVTTHPIEFTVENTDVVFANFDGITYGKGASVLKQLAFYIGDDNFKKGLQSYFSKYAFKNTELKDFMAELAAASQMSLADWQAAWLKTPQVNTVRVDYSCEQGLTKNTTLHQSAPKDYPTLRPHKTQVAVFTMSQERFSLLKTADVSYSGDKTSVKDLDGLKCDQVALVYPNFNDYDYALAELDKVSLQTLMKDMSRIDDDLLKVGLWRTLWDMVEAQKVSAVQVFDIILKHSVNEKNLDVLQDNLERAYEVAFYYQAKDEKNKKLREEIVARFVKYCWQQTLVAKTEDLQKLWFGFYVQSAESSEDLDRLMVFLTKAPKELKFPIDQDRRWKILHQLSEKAHKNYAQLVDAEKARDRSARAEKYILASQAAVPQLAVKKEFWKKVSKGPHEELPLGKMGPVIGSLFPAEQESLHRQFSDEFFSSLRDLKSAPGEFLRVYTGLAPSFCATESVNQLRSFVEANGDLPPSVLKSLKIKAQMSERCVGIRQKMADEVKAGAI